MSRTFLLPLLLAASLAAVPVQAAWVGDLVYCDVDNDGVYNTSVDFPLNEVSVTVSCTGGNGEICSATTTTTGAPDSGVNASVAASFCGDEATWDISDPMSDQTGRYLVAVGDCAQKSGAGPKWSCQVTVDENTLPPNCNVLGTPRVTAMGNMPARPVDGNIDGKFCDAGDGDGPFPEGQPLGNASSYFGCAAYPDPAPGDGTYNVEVSQSSGDQCNLHNDFGYKPPAPSIMVEKFTNGHDADSADGPLSSDPGPMIPGLDTVPLVDAGDAVEWTYEVTNSGAETLINVNVVDPKASISCPRDVLEPSASMTCTASGVGLDLSTSGGVDGCRASGTGTPAPAYENTVTAKGTGVGSGLDVSDTDLSHYCNPPDVQIVKRTNGHDANNADGIPAGSPGPDTVAEVSVGGEILWTYEVTNSSSETLANVVVTDDQGVSVACPQDSLAPGETMTCTASGLAVDLATAGAGPGCSANGMGDPRPTYVNVGTVNANGAATGLPVEASDPSAYCNPPPPEICGLTVEKGCALPPPPPSPAGKCDGRLQQFTMIWTGGPITVSGPSNNAPGGVVNNGQEVTFTGPFSDNDVVVTLSGGGQSTFHTSCSDKDMDGDTASNEDQQQVSSFGRDCGKFQGNGKGSSGVNLWLLEGFVDKEGAVLDCTVPADGGPLVSSCEFSVGPVSCDDTGKPSVITMQYTGGACPGNNTQGGKSSCSGSVDPGQPVMVTLDGGTIGPINPGQSFDVPTTGSNTVISLSNAGGTQSNNVHTSCSAPLIAGETFGGMTLTALDGQGLNQEIIYSYLISNTGDTAISGITAVDDQLGPVGGPLSLGAGESTLLTATALVDETVTNIVTVTGALASGVQCEAIAQATVTRVVPPVPPASCADGKPQTLVFEYTGGNCAASSNTQGDKAKCSGALAGEQPVTIAYVGKDTNKIAVLPSGQTINVGTQVTIDAFDRDTLHSNTKLEVSQGGNLLQELEIHTSCSAPLNIGDQFGSLILREFVPEN